MSATSVSSGINTPSETAAHRRHVERARQRDEPTRTKTIRARYARRLRGRWAAIMAALREGVVERDAFGLRTEALVETPTPREFDFPTEADRTRRFEAWLERQTDRQILERFGGENQFITRAYEQGVDDAQTELRTLGLSEGTAGATATQLPIHRTQLENLYARNFRALEGMTDATANGMRRTLAEGLASGDGPRDIARRLSDRVDSVGKTRANVIARTEVMHSHNRARATEWQRGGVERVTILLAPDACPECQALKAGAPYAVDEAPGLLPQHPNCRCSLSIHTGGG